MALASALVVIGYALFVGGMSLLLVQKARHEDPSPSFAPADVQARDAAADLTDRAADGVLDDSDLILALGDRWTRRDEPRRIVLVAALVWSTPPACFRVEVPLPLGKAGPATATVLPSCPALTTH